MITQEIALLRIADFLTDKMLFTSYADITLVLELSDR